MPTEGELLVDGQPISGNRLRAWQQIISPGHLPNNLTVEKIRTGNSNIRNPILVSYVAKGLLPYHGLGSGIKRALSLWPKIEFTDDRNGCLFTATVHRIPSKVQLPEQAVGVNVGVKGLLAHVQANPGLRAGNMTVAFAVTQRTVERWLKQLKAQGLVEFSGAPCPLNSTRRKMQDARCNKTQDARRKMMAP